MHVRICLLAVCFMLIVSIKPIYAEDVAIKIKTPYLEMKPESFKIGPLSPKVGPGGGGNINIIMTGH